MLDNENNVILAKITSLIIGFIQVMYCELVMETSMFNLSHTG